MWNTDSLKSPLKYDVILNYFTKKLLLDTKYSSSDVQRMLKLKHPPNCVSAETKKKLIRSLGNLVSTNPSVDTLTTCLEVVSNESFKDFFKAHLKVYCKLLGSMIGSCQLAGELDDTSTVFSSIIAELYCFAKLETFKELFLEHLIIPLSAAAGSAKLDSPPVWDLLQSVFFTHLASPDTNLDVFELQLPQNKLAVLTEAFITINKSKPLEIAKFMLFLNERMFKCCDVDVEFLSKVKQVFLLLKSHDVDLAPIKRQQPELFEELTTRINAAVETSKLSMDFADFLGTVTAFINCDAFLFEKNIFGIVTECMLRDKSGDELVNYEQLLAIVIKIYAKDLNQFLKKLLKSIEEKLETFKMPKRRKRKLVSISEVTPKKVKLASSEVPVGWSHIVHIWPSAMSEQFAEIIAGLNVAQSIKVWNQLNEFLVGVLNQVKESSEINENVLFKVDFASSLLCEVFSNTRLHEQLMYKPEEVAAPAREFSKTQNLFCEILLNIEYDSRVMNAFLRISSSYENFLMLYFYHHNPEVKSELTTLFIDSQTRIKNEWNIIQQRIKNFGKTEEKNHLNSLMIQQQQKVQLFGSSEAATLGDFTSIFNDDKQVEFLLQKPDTRSFFINSLDSKKLRMFAQFLLQLGDREVQAASLNIIAQSQTLLDGFITELLLCAGDDNFQATLELLQHLPLACSSDDNKKKIFGEILQRKCSEDIQPMVERVVKGIFQNDSYKAFFKDFSMQQVVKVFKGGEKFARIHKTILGNTARKLNASTMTNFDWILKNGDMALIEALAVMVNEVSHTKKSKKSSKFNFKIPPGPTCSSEWRPSCCHRQIQARVGSEVAGEFRCEEASRRWFHCARQAVQ